MHVTLDQDQRRSGRRRDSTKASTKDHAPGTDSPRKDYLKELHVDSLRSHVELSFDMEGSNKPIWVLYNAIP